MEWILQSSYVWFGLAVAIAVIAAIARMVLSDRSDPHMDFLLPLIEDIHTDEVPSPRIHDLDPVLTKQER